MNDPFKEEYRGVYNAYMWHNRYNMNRIRSGDISLKDYISSFDYVLYRKNVNTEPDIIDYLEGEALTQLEWCAESESHILYRVVSGSPEEPLKRNDFEAQTQQYYSREVLRK